jgi:hypothetical protein
MFYKAIPAIAISESRKKGATRFITVSFTLFLGNHTKYQLIFVLFALRE